MNMLNLAMELSDGLPDIPELHFFRPQTRFSSNVIVIFLKSLNVWKDIACRDSLHESFKICVIS